MTVPLLAVALCLSVAAPASAADGTDETEVSADQSDTLRVVRSAQSEVDTDPDSGSDQRLVDRDSSERIDAVVVALWTIAAVMTVLLGVFLWHTSPRRRLRLAVGGSAGLSDEDGGDSESAARESEESGEDLSPVENESEEPEGDAESWQNRLSAAFQRVVQRVTRTESDLDAATGGEPEPEAGEEDGGQRSV